MFRRLGSYPRQSGRAIALRELGLIERPLRALDWMQRVGLRRHVQVGLIKGEAKNALTRVVFLNRLGEIRDRSYANQRLPASARNLGVSAIIFRITIYSERTFQAPPESGQDIDDRLLSHLPPLGWEHINLTGDYIWQHDKRVVRGRCRPIQTPPVLGVRFSVS